MTPITPDTKDWTWVLERTCPECGFDVRGFPREQVGTMIRQNARAWEEVLQHPKVRERPSDDKWSALEYACHVRDVYRLYTQRLDLMLTRENPTYANWDQNEAAVSGRYGEQEPGAVLTELSDAAGELAGRFDSVEGNQWNRAGLRSDGASFTIESFARYLIHDPIHHLYDVESGFEELD